jgi:ubiquinone/menaquinone biosynthesis C-methylase UbiE
MDSYYTETLAAEKLKRCYELAPRRIRQYLNAEIQYVRGKIDPGSHVLELGCGYGRVLKQLCSISNTVVGIDTSLASLIMARRELSPFRNYLLCKMDAVSMGFKNDCFDLTVCIQNGLSAFKVDPYDLISEAARVTKKGGIVLISSYSEKFWQDRLHWFRLQSDAGLLGEIDCDLTKDGTIICKDGFKATTISPEQFRLICDKLALRARTFEIDASALFCEIVV